MNPIAHLFDFERPVTPGDRVVFRLFEAFTAYLALAYAWSWAAYLQRMERMVAPAGIGHYLDVTVLFDHGLAFVNAGVITGLVLLGLTRRWRYAYLLALFLLHVQHAARFSLGKISHGSFFAGLALLGLGLAFAAYRDPRHVQRFATGFTLFFFGFGYLTAAVCKLVGTGLLWPDGRHLWMWIHERGVDVLSTAGVYEPSILQQLTLNLYPLATLLLVFGLIAELGGWLLWYPRMRPFMAVLLAGLHVGIFFSLQISFWGNVVYLLLLGLPWPVWLERVAAAHRLLPSPLQRYFRSA